MPRISDSQGRPDENSAYVRLFGNVKLGLLISRVQAAVIRAGNELETIVKLKTSPEQISTLDEVLNPNFMVPTEVQVVFQPHMPKVGDQHGEKIDLVIFRHKFRNIMVIELKDGDTFDTKKSSGELESMRRFAKWISDKTGYSANFYFCSFNQDSKDAIIRGAKGRFSTDNALTGRELCELLSINYDELRAEREREQPENLRYFLMELLRITEIKSVIVDMLRGEKRDD